MGHVGFFFIQIVGICRFFFYVSGHGLFDMADIGFNWQFTHQRTCSYRIIFYFSMSEYAFPIDGHALKEVFLFSYKRTCFFSILFYFFIGKHASFYFFYRRTCNKIIFYFSIDVHASLLFYNRRTCFFLLDMH